MVYSFARVSAVVGMRVEDYYQQGKRWWLRLQEKGGKHHAVPVHHKAEAYLDAAGIAAEKDAPLWRSMPRAGGMGARRAVGTNEVLNSSNVVVVDYPLNFHKPGLPLLPGFAARRLGAWRSQEQRDRVLDGRR